MSLMMYRMEALTANSSCDGVMLSCRASGFVNTTNSGVGGISTQLPPGSSENDVDLYRATPGVVALLSVLYGSLSVAAVLGNVLVIAVVATNRSMQTVTNFFIANLSGADVVVGVFSIPFQFQAALLQRWDLPEPLCPIAPFVRDVSVNVSIGALVVIAIDRYCAVMRPLQARFNQRLAQVIDVINVFTFFIQVTFFTFLTFLFILTASLFFLKSCQKQSMNMQKSSEKH